MKHPKDNQIKSSYSVTNTNIINSMNKFKVTKNVPSTTNSTKMHRSFEHSTFIPITLKGKGRNDGGGNINTTKKSKNFNNDTISSKIGKTKVFGSDSFQFSK